MLKFLRKHQKKFLAVFTAGLMIVFVADYGINRGLRQRAVNPDEKVMGRFAGTEVRARDLAIAETIVQQLVYQYVFVPPPGSQGQQQPVPLVKAIGMPDSVIIGWLRNPTAFYLLLEEARRMPVYVDPRDVEAFTKDLAVQQPDGSIVHMDDLRPGAAANVRANVAALLTVFGAFNRMVDMFKVSQPFLYRSAVEEGQVLTLWSVAIDAGEFIERAPQPTDEQLNELFRKYADSPRSGMPTESNPLALGYRYPPRLKLQYISIPRQQIVNTIKARKSDYEWERDANRYYLEHQKEFFTATPPTTGPTTDASTDPSTQPATVKPFAEVRQQILDKLMAPDVNKLEVEVRRKIQSTMAADYQAWTQAHGPAAESGARADGGAKADAGGQVNSSLGVPYDSYEYLEKLADAVQQQFGVRPKLASIGDFKSEEELREMEGAAAIVSEAFDLAAPLANQPATDRAAPPPARENLLKLYQPSQPKPPSADDTYFYRITDASPAHAPADITEIAQRVRDDWKLTWAWEQARAEARALAERAQTTDVRHIAGQRKVSTVGPFPRALSWGAIPGLDATGLEARFMFLDEAFKLISDLTDQRQHPARVIELPTERTILVAQLASLENRLNPQAMQYLPLEWPRVIRQQWGQATIEQWFSYTGVAARLGYIDRETEQRQAAQKEEASQDSRASTPAAAVEP